MSSGSVCEDSSLSTASVSSGSAMLASGSRGIRTSRQQREGTTDLSFLHADAQKQSIVFRLMDT